MAEKVEITKKQERIDADTLDIKEKVVYKREKQEYIS